MTIAPVTTAAVIDGVDVDAVAAAVTGCPGVADLCGGPGDTIASYLPGRRVPGVEIAPTAVVITVRSRWDVTAPALLEQISGVLTPILHGKHLEIVVADIDDPSDPALASAAATPASDTTPTAAPVAAATAPPAVRLPGSSPAPTEATPSPAPPHFPTA